MVVKLMPTAHSTLGSKTEKGDEDLKRIVKNVVEKSFPFESFAVRNLKIQEIMAELQKEQSKDAFSSFLIAFGKACKSSDVQKVELIEKLKKQIEEQKSKIDLARQNMFEINIEQMDAGRAQMYNVTVGNNEMGSFADLLHGLSHFHSTQSFAEQLHKQVNRG
ncbi:hypothetical protein DID78_04205 [Candidatus Marinamargulisbacteria bacterium SCGC AG-343-D04]|nr:hypothetical protein DID78_04205 [Candidatus Marinamargulisbacteria bacterium SCGC AG-343-D04]